MEKRCSYCAEWLPLENYYKSSHTKDCLQAYCKACCKAYARKRKTNCVITDNTVETLEAVKEQIRKATQSARSLHDLFRICKSAKVHGYLERINLGDVLTPAHLQQIMSLVPYGHQFED